MNQETTQKRSWLKTSAKALLWVAVILFLALAVAYWTAPSWVPGQVQKFLPASVQIQDLKLKRPGLKSTQIDEAVIHFGERPQYQVKLNNVELGYSLWQQKLTSISAQSAQLIWPESSQNSAKSEPLQAIPLPTLPVPEITLEQITVEGLTLQSITATDIVLKENINSLSLAAEVKFLDKTFDVATTASRSNQSLSEAQSTITQGQNTVELMANPINNKHWRFQTNGTVDIQEFYPQPGISPVNFNLAGQVNLTESPAFIKLAATSQITTTIDSHQLGLNSTIKELLAQYHITTNLDQTDPKYRVTLQPQTDLELSYQDATSQLTLQQGQLGLDLDNTTLSANSSMSKLELYLDKPLSAEGQLAHLSSQLSITGLKGQFDSPEHTATSSSLDFSVATVLKLDSSSLTVDATKGALKLGKLDYKGNNSTSDVTPSQWSFNGTSMVDFSNPQSSEHRWHITSSKPLSGNLKLSNEQFVATNLNTKFNFTQGKQSPNGKISGTYQLTHLALQQQPLKLDDIKGNLTYELSKVPHGQLSFNSARYKNKQIGVSNIAGDVNWSKRPQSFVAGGVLKHNQSKVPFDYSFNLESSRHHLKIDQSSLPVSTLTSWVNILKDYPQLRFSSGQLEIDSLDGDPIGLLFDGKIKLDNFDLNYDEFYIKNWTIEDSLTSSSKLGGTLKSHIDRIELAADIAITDVSFLMPHTINSLVVTNLKGNLLKGTIEIPSLAIGENGVSPFIAYLKAIEIGTLLKALNSEKLMLTGRFDFTLPLNLSEKGQQITNGKFKALEEGVIKLKSDKGKEANIAFQALENFHYKEFSGTINYNLDGDYLIELNVLGSNPELYNGFPIKLDLTLRGQLPELLYSMIVSGDMTKPILEDLKQKEVLNIQP